MSANLHTDEASLIALPPSSNDPTDWLQSEPSVASRLSDSLVIELLEVVPVAYQALAAELWLRRWLYAGECPTAIDDAITSAQVKNLAGFSEMFHRRFESELLPLRGKDPGHAFPEAGPLNPEETRIWGLLKARAESFLEADGLIALIAQGTPDNGGVVVSFRFVSGEPGACFDAKGTELSEWTEIIEELGSLGPSAGGLALRIDATFPRCAPPASGASLGLPVALAWERRQARDFPLFSSLTMLATGEVIGERVFAVRGTGGESATDRQGGAKGQLARRLGVRIYVALDISPNVSRGDINLCCFTSGTAWVALRSKCAQVFAELNLTDATRHLNRIETEDGDTISVGEPAPDELWAKWRRLKRLIEYQRRTGDVSGLGKTEACCRKVAYDLGFISLASGACDFSAVEARHPAGELPGRRRELEKLDHFLNGPGGVLLVTAPLGHGKSALVTSWRRKIEERRTHSVFYHYFDQSDERCQSPAVFYRRLQEHLLLAAEEQPPDKEQPSEQDVLVAWDRWKATNGRRPFVVVIDGLDETTSFTLPLSRSLPKEVWFVVSCRSGEGSSLHPFAAAWKKRAEDSGIPCQQFEVPPLDIPSLESWLAKSLAVLDESLRVNLPRMAYLAALIRDRSEGNALWVHLFLPEFCHAIAKRERWQDVLNPVRTPMGLTSLLTKQWQRLNDAAVHTPAAELAVEIVAQLIAARGPLTNRELTILMGKSPLMDLSNLSPEARRWVDVRRIDDPWGARFSLNHWLIRNAIAPKNSAFRQEIEVRYIPRLLDYCRQHWTNGSPYALRHLPEDLIKHGVWDELDTLVTNPEFQRLQRLSFPDEPALALLTVRRALEAETTSEQPDPKILTELSLTHAALVYQLAKPISPADASMSVLELAEHMTRIPMQWDPAAKLMWHLLAAWLLHKEGHKAERNTHLNALAAIRDVRLPAAWGLLAGVILVETVSPFNPLLPLLAKRFLSRDATAEMLGRLTRQGNAGVRVARQWLRFCVRDEDSTFRSHIVSSLANAGRWKEAEWEARAALTIKGQANLFLQLAELAKGDLGCTNNLRQWVEYLEPYVEYADLSQGDFLKINTILGCIMAVRVRHHLLRGHNDAQLLVRQAETFVRSERFARGSGQFDVQVALTLAYGAAAANRGSKAAQIQLEAQAQQHRRKAFRAWLRLRQRTNASTLEVFQLWLWFADLTLQLVGQNVLPRKIGTAWERRLRRTLLPEEGDDDARIFRLLNAGMEGASAAGFPDGSKRPEPRYLEPVEWNHAIVAAVEAMAEAEGFTDIQVLQVICRGSGSTDRARCLARWVKKLVGGGRAGDAEPTLQNALDKGDFGREDVAAAHSLLARRLLYAGSHAAAAYHAAATIRYGTDGLRGPKSQQRVEILTALSCAAGAQGVGLFDQAAKLVHDRRHAGVVQKTFSYLHLAEVAHIRKESKTSSHWFDAVLKLQYLPGYSYQGRSAQVTVLCSYARRLFLLQLNKPEREKVLVTARKAAQGERSLIRRCELLCEVAEAYSFCGDLESTDQIFVDIQVELPVTVQNGMPWQGFLWRKRGVKQSLVRGHCLAEFVLGLGKAAIAKRDSFRQDALRGSPQPWHPWSEWMDSRSFTPRQRTVVRNSFNCFKCRDLSGALKWGTNIPIDPGGGTALRMAVCREIIGYLPWSEWMEARSFTSNQRENIRQVYDSLCSGEPAAAFEHSSRISEDSSVAMALRLAICRELASHCELTDWALIYRDDLYLKEHQEVNQQALRGWALALAVQNNWDEAWRLVESIADPSVSASTIRDLAELSARTGSVEDVLRRAKSLMSSREKDRVLHRVGAALFQRYRQTESSVEKKDVRRALIYLFPSCAEFYGATYLMLARLVEIEPSCWRIVADVLQRRGLIKAFASPKA